jgi:hypothetical protein
VSNDAHTLRIDSIFWRMKFVHEAGDILGPVQSPEGRSHYNGQRALYLSETAEGAIVASRRYMRPDDPPRAIYPLRVSQARVVDLRDRAATEYFGIDTTHRALEWQSLRAQGLPSPTWEISDRVRTLGLDGMLYASRTDPTKMHLTLFRWNEPGTEARLTPEGAPLPFAQP